jgi:LmbE family N-acetylglucosaminyl deacetylase
MSTVMSPSAAELDAWDAYLREGSQAKAARALGCHVQTIKARIAALKDFYGVETTAQLATAIAEWRTTKVVA